MRTVTGGRGSSPAGATGRPAARRASTARRPPPTPRPRRRASGSRRAATRRRPAAARGSGSSRSSVGTMAKRPSLENAAGIQPSESAVTAAWSIGCGGSSRSQARLRARSAGRAGAPPPAQRMPELPVEAGRAVHVRSAGQSSGAARSGIARSAHSGSPSRQPRSAPSASATGRPSCSRRRLSAVLERPARSTVARTSSGPSAGASTKCTVKRARRRAGIADRRRSSPGQERRQVAAERSALDPPVGGDRVRASVPRRPARARCRRPGHAVARQHSSLRRRCARPAPRRRPTVLVGDRREVERGGDVEQHPRGEEHPDLLGRGAREPRDLGHDLAEAARARGPGSRGPSSATYPCICIRIAWRSGSSSST